MKTRNDIDCAVDALEFLLWDKETQEYKAIEELSDAEKKAVLVNRDLLFQALESFSQNIKDFVGEDLRDIWRRLDKIEKMLS